MNGFRLDVFEAYMAENSTELREFRLPEIKLTMTLKGKQFRQGALTIIFWGDYSGLALKLQKVDPIFYKFQSVSILAIRSNG